MACGIPVIHTAAGPTEEFVPESAGWAVNARRVPVPSHFEVPELAGPAYVHEVDHGDLVAALRAAASSPGARADRSRGAVAAAAQLTWNSVAQIAHRSLSSLASESLPPARQARPDAVERADGTTLVVYAPDWSHESRWTNSLTDWVRAFQGIGSVTLAMPCGGEDPMIWHRGSSHASSLPESESARCPT